MINYVEFDMEIGKLFDILNMNSEASEECFIAPIEIEVMTPEGNWTKINHFVLKNNIDMLDLRLSNNIHQKVAKKHIFSYKNFQTDTISDVFAEDAKYVQFCDGHYENVISKIEMGKQKAYDININYPHLYLDSHGAIHHNTLMVEQVCSELNRECIRVNISIETDESDLIGGPTLIDGNIVIRDGPVITAMRKGSILLIDEIDRGSNKLMCIQGILEGKPYYNKKSGEVIYPQPGFNVIATANSKGHGSENGKYLSQILDDAFLERFPITIEQEYPSSSVEKKILKHLIDDESFVDMLIEWAASIRKTFNDGGVDEIISTRRLVHIAKAYSIYGDRLKSIQYCVNRFDSETRDSFIDLYTKIDESVVKNSTPKVEEKQEQVFDKEIPF